MSGPDRHGTGKRLLHLEFWIVLALTGGSFLAGLWRWFESVFD